MVDASYLNIDVLPSSKLTCEDVYYLDKEKSTGCWRLESQRPNVCKERLISSKERLLIVSFGWRNLTSGNSSSASERLTRHGANGRLNWLPGRIQRLNRSRFLRFATHHHTMMGSHETTNLGVSDSSMTHRHALGT